MKRLWIVTAILLALLLGTVTVWHFMPRGARTADPLYAECASVDGVRAGFIENFRFNDSTLVDVTTVEALDAAGWEWMQRRFEVPPPDSLQVARMARGSRVMYTSRGDSDSLFLFLSYNDSSLCMVHVSTESQFESILRYHLQLLKQ